MDKIVVEKIKLRGRHGVHSSEWEKDQEFTIDVIADVDIKKAATSDTLEDTVCWTHLYDIAKSVIEGPSMRLVERLATTIADRILSAEPRVTSVTVKLYKSEVLLDGLPGVIITRTQK